MRNNCVMYLKCMYYSKFQVLKVYTKMKLSSFKSCENIYVEKDGSYVIISDFKKLEYAEYSNYAVSLYLG